MAKVKIIKTETIQVDVYIGEVECLKCNTTNSIVENSKYNLTIYCSKCNEEILCEWHDEEI